MTCPDCQGRKPNHARPVCCGDHELREQAMIGPEIKTQTISEVVFTNRQLLELVRTCYGTDVVSADAEVVGHFPHGKLEGLKFVWKLPVQ